MKKSIKQIAKVFGLVLFFFVIAPKQSEAQTQWTYALSLNNVTYKAHFATANGNMTIQVYDSNSNKWSFGTIVAQQAESGQNTTYYKVKVGGTIYEFWAYSNGSLLVKTNGGQWTYNLESSK
ncbi:MAG TPA: hypothetical protein VD905_11095 [Flavobacteriales bacterium]|nr:hypothetical protein [Flavobacteriales bacterium]